MNKKQKLSFLEEVPRRTWEPPAKLEKDPGDRQSCPGSSGFCGVCKVTGGAALLAPGLGLRLRLDLGQVRVPCAPDRVNAGSLGWGSDPETSPQVSPGGSEGGEKLARGARRLRKEAWGPASPEGRICCLWPLRFRVRP